MSTVSRPGTAPSPISPLGVKKFETTNGPSIGPDLARSSSAGGPQATRHAVERSAAVSLASDESVGIGDDGVFGRDRPTVSVSGKAFLILEMGPLRHSFARVKLIARHREPT